MPRNPEGRTRVLFIQGGGEGAYDEDKVLADSLRQALGDGYEVLYPRMPDEANPESQAWRKKLSAELARLRAPALLVGHSIGGSILLKYLAETGPGAGGGSGTPIAGLYLLAAPAYDGEKWAFEDLKLPKDAAAKLADIPRICLYHCRDDEVVPFAHLAIHGARLPGATLRETDGGGHQFGNDLKAIAADIRAAMGKG